MGPDSKIFNKYKAETRSGCEVKKLKKPWGEKINWQPQLADE